ncbi:MAG: metallophosphoesterase family protein [Candidatus Micrarchaeia archaeon]
MKIAIVSDMHLGYERFAADTYAQAKEALEKAAAVADMIIMPGDIFDKRFPRPDVLAQGFNMFRDLSRKEWKARVTGFDSKSSKAFTDVPVIAIPGTHERTSIGKENPLNLLSIAGLLVDTSEATTTVEKDGERVSVFGMGGVSEELVRQKLAELAPEPVSGAFNIFMFHQSIYELLPFSEDFIHFEELPKGFDLYVDGHIHNKLIAKVHGKKFIIPGSTVLTQLKDDEQDQKGFFLFNTASYSEQFIPINSRPFKSLHIRFSGATPSEIESGCDAAIKGAVEELRDSSGRIPIVRLVVEGTAAKGLGASDLLLNALAKRYSEKAILSIDVSRLESPEVAMSIDGVRNSRLGGMPIKELGLAMFAKRLKELGYGGSDAAELFVILSSEGSKEKVLKEAEKHLEEGAQQ